MGRPERNRRPWYWRLPGGHYLREEQDMLVLYEPDGTPMDRFGKERAIIEVIEEVVEKVITHDRRERRRESNR